MKVSIRSETPESIENHSELSELVQISSNCNENDSTVPVDECLSATPTSSVAETVIVQIEHEPKGQNDETDSKTVTGRHLLICRQFSQVLLTKLI